MNLNKYRSASDKKNYELIHLGSGLEVLLISRDATTDAGESSGSKAAAALSVETGSFADPSITEGCAHFLEHMLFMGSDKYPEENYYDSFVTTHGGSCNASTSGEYTTYEFDVNNEAFGECLDIFAQCFMSPLLVDTSADKEIKAIESEFKLAQTSDGSRVQQLMFHLAEEHHILTKFSWGNHNSLSVLPQSKGIDRNSVLRAFYNKHYRPSNMKLVVMAPKSLDALKTDVLASFEPWKQKQFTVDSARIEGKANCSDGGGGSKHRSKRQKPEENSASNSNSSSSNNNTHTNGGALSLVDDLSQLPSMSECLAPWSSPSMRIWGPSCLKTVHRILPLKKSHTLYMTWQLPSVCAHYRSKPCEYIGHLLGHESKGSILSVLKELNYAQSLCAGTSDNMTDNSMFTCLELSVTLTERGIANWPLVVLIVHQYLAMLRHVGPQEWIFKELQRTHELSYEYKDEEDYCETVEYLSQEMVSFCQRRREDLLSAEDLFFDWKPELISEYMSAMTPANTKLFIASHMFALDEDDGEEDDNDDGSCDDDDDDEDSGGEEDDDDAEDSDSDDDDDEEEEEEEDEEVLEAQYEALLRRIESQFHGPKPWKPLCVEEPRSEPELEPHFKTNYWAHSLPKEMLDMWETQSVKGFTRNGCNNTTTSCSTAAMAVAEASSNPWDAFNNSKKAKKGKIVANKGSASPSAVVNLWIEQNESLFADFASKLHLPRVNEYIAQTFTMVVAAAADATDDAAATITASAVAAAAPEMIPIANGLTLWHQNSTNFQTPKVEVRYRLTSSAAVSSAPIMHRDLASGSTHSLIHMLQRAVFNDLLYSLWKEISVEHVYMAEMAELYCRFSCFESGIAMRISGFSDKAPLLAREILNLLTTVDALLDNYVSAAANYSTIQDSRIASFGASSSSSSLPQAKSNKKAGKGATLPPPPPLSLAADDVCRATATDNNNTLDRVVEMLILTYQRSHTKSSQSAKKARLLALKVFAVSDEEKLHTLQNLLLLSTAATSTAFSKTTVTTGELSTTSGAPTIAASKNVAFVATFREFVRQFMSSLYIEAMSYGNVHREEVVALTKMVFCPPSVKSDAKSDDVATKSCSKPNVLVTTNASNRLCEEILLLEWSPTVPMIHYAPTNPKESNVTVELYFQLGVDFDLVHLSRLSLLEQLLSEPFFDDLRTNQQLGYSVSCGLRDTYGVLGFCFAVTSSSHKMDAILTALLTFARNDSVRLLQNMSLEQFDQSVAALVSNTLEPDLSLSEAADFVWSEIENGKMDFHCRQKQADILRSPEYVSPNHIISLCEDMFVNKPRMLLCTSSVAGYNADQDQAAVKALYPEFEKVECTQAKDFRSLHQKFSSFQKK